MTEKIKIASAQYGGKSTISKWIVSHMPEHRVYVEPFVGSASILFAKPKSFIEIINDLDCRIVNVFKKIREEPEKLAALLWGTPYSNSNWRDIPENADELELARLYIAQTKQYYCGNTNTSTFSIDKSPGAHKPRPEVWADWFLRILPAANRLRTCEILNEDALTTISRVYKDSKQTFIMADPPYTNHEKEYSYKVNYEKIVEMLKSATCNVMVCEYPEAEKYFQGWRMITKECVGSCATGRHGKSKPKLECLFLNY